MNEELTEIISLVSRYTEVPKTEILTGRNHIATKARGFVCHIVRDAYPHLIDPLCEVTERTKTAIMLLAKATEERITGDIDTRVLMNEIRIALRLPTIKPKQNSCHITDTKTLFGFDYTEEDVQERMVAAHNANVYMAKLCKIGRQPIEAGMVFSPVRPKRTYSKWYNA